MSKAKAIEAIEERIISLRKSIVGCNYLIQMMKNHPNRYGEGFNKKVNNSLFRNKTKL